MREVIARIKVQLRRPSEASPVLRAGPLELDRTRCQVRLHGNEVPLTATEFRLLEYLMGRAGIVFSREQLLDSVWGNDRAVTDRTVDVYVLRLRQKLESEPANPQLIRSVRGFGYSFNETLTRSIPAQTARPKIITIQRHHQIDIVFLTLFLDAQDRLKTNTSA